jgi:polyferredoxin
MYKIIGADQNQYGPVSAEEMRQWIAEGRVNAQTLIQAEGQADWRPLSSFPEFATVAQPLPSGTPFATGQPSPSTTNTMALIGMISGILCLPFTCCCYGFPFNILAIVFSAIGLSQTKMDPAARNSRNMAKAGLILGIIQLVLIVVLVLLGVALNFNEIVRNIKR